MMRFVCSALLGLFLLSAAARAENTNSATDEKTLTAQASQTVEQGISKVRSIWDWELYPISPAVLDKHDKVIKPAHSLTLGLLTLGLICLVVGIALSKLISRTVSDRIQRKFSIDATRSEGLEKAFFFALLCAVVLSILGWLHIPLTAFAFLGGALAIGVGFGAQTVVNNFISGLILLVERRIKVGDYIEVDVHKGKVLNLGTRCSRISKGDGVEVLVPNSYLLEKNVSNWTLAGTHHRYDFTVGLAYGASAGQAIKLLQQAVEQEEKVLKNPKPQVFFDDFGNTSLVFRIVYWLDLRVADNNLVGSNIRLRIEQMCSENNLAFQVKQPGVVQLNRPA